MMRRFGLGFWAFAASLAGAATAQSLPSDAPAAATPPLSLGEDPIDQLTVPVMVNGQGPFRFVVDTGADHSVISSELADKLGLPSGDKVRLHSVGGQASVRTVNIKMIQVSTNIVRNINTAALPARNLGGDGLLGIDSLKGQRLVIDFRAKTMEVLPSLRGEKPPPEDAQMIIVTAKTRLGQLVMVDAAANGEKLYVVVDTGGQNSIGNTRLRQLLLKRDSKAEVKPIVMTDVLGKEILADYIDVGRLRIGDINMDHAPIAFADVHPFKLFDLERKPSLMLGMELLRNFQRVSIDFTSRTIKFLLPPQGVPVTRP